MRADSGDKTSRAVRPRVELPCPGCLARKTPHHGCGRVEGVAVDAERHDVVAESRYQATVALTASRRGVPDSPNVDVNFFVSSKKSS